LLGLRFEQPRLSVFRTHDQFEWFNPVMPLLLWNDGAVLRDPALINECAEAIPGKRRSLVP
jgi:hypothetical protein